MKEMTHMIEICCGGYKDIENLKDLSIDRFELNTALELGGLTANIIELKEAKKITDIPICCRLRVRPGDFNYTQTEMDLMLSQAQTLLENGADGIVFGFLTNNAINTQNTKSMVSLINKYGKEAIFHKAIDEVIDYEASIQQLVDCGVHRVLTSGQKDSIIDGMHRLNKTVKQFGDVIDILACGHIRSHNFEDILHKSLAKQHHTSCMIIDPIHQNAIVDRQQVKALLAIMNRFKQ